MASRGEGLERVLQLVVTLSDGRPHLRSWLAQKFKCSQRTIRRDLAVLERVGFVFEEGVTPDERMRAWHQMVDTETAKLWVEKGIGRTP